jgi:hypothetical protein
MNKTVSAPVAKFAGNENKEVEVVKKGSLFGKMIDTKKALKAYLKGELTLSELESMGIEVG